MLERILGHLGLPTTPPPVAPPRLPRDDDLVLALDEDPPDQGDGEVATAARRRTRYPPHPDRQHHASQANHATPAARHPGTLWATLTR
ncbi:MAG: hypothetical protein RBU45_23845 [Myxococcota bacterium]|nr:hypothetical protein [Myxococcota bacterium]